MKKDISLQLAVAAVLFAAVGGALGGVIRVPGDYSTIQGALNAAWINDTVLVASGTYIENIVWPCLDSIVLLSELGPDSTIIDGDAVDRVVTMSPHIDTNTVMSGFTICNGAAEFGAGILCQDNSSPKIRNNRVINNDAVGTGGGIDCLSDASPVIEGALIESNHGSAGGGIHCHYSSPRIRNSIITSNSAWTGGGIYIDDSSPIIENCRIIGNSAVTHAGGIYFGGSFPLITGSTISGNVGGPGAGIYCSGGEPYPPIRYNNVYGHNGAAVYNNNPSYRTVATYNWWGDPTGPYHPALNPGGLGDTVGNYVTFIPWLTEPVGVQEGLEDLVLSDVACSLGQNYPNPFRNSTRIDLRGSSDFAVLEVYDVSGRLLRTLVDGQRQGGHLTVRWDGKDQGGRRVTSGVYFYRLRADQMSESKRMVLLR